MNDMTSKDVALLDCPFCGGPAETDSLQAYRAIGTGDIGYAAAVYCTGSCSAQMSLCYADVPDLPRNRVLEVLVENWNRRRAVETPQPASNRKLQTRLREIAERLLCREGSGHYCPNCGNTTFDAAMSLKLLADQIGTPVETSGSGWQPIATAPRMRDILVYYVNSCGKGRTVRACYFEENTLENNGTQEEEYAPAGWYESPVEAEQCDHLSEDPTHWMPLPKPPGLPLEPSEQRLHDQGSQSGETEPHLNIPGLVAPTTGTSAVNTGTRSAENGKALP